MDPLEMTEELGSHDPRDTIEELGSRDPRGMTEPLNEGGSPAGGARFGRRLAAARAIPARSVD